MKLTAEEACEIIDGDHEDWEKVQKTITGKSRWSIHRQGIFRHLPTGKLYKLEWSEGATEQQSEEPFQYADPELIEVQAVEKVVTVYEEV